MLVWHDDVKRRDVLFEQCKFDNLSNNYYDERFSNTELDI